MPSAAVKQISEQCGLPEARVEHLWKKAKSVAKEKGLKAYKNPTTERQKSANKKFYSYTMGILKHMITKSCTKDMNWKFPERWIQEAASQLSSPLSVTGFDPRWLSSLSSDDVPDDITQQFSSQSFGIHDYGSTTGNETKSYDADKVLNKKSELEIPGLSDHAVPISASFWLPLAADHYKISKDLRNYVLMVTPSMISDIPNTKADSVSLPEMLRFNPSIGMPAFRSFVGKPCFREHANNDIAQSKGVILDVFLRPLKGFANNKHAKLIQLLAIDKDKDKDLAYKVEAGEINTVSVGIYYSCFSCSICGNLVSPTQGQPCVHTNLKVRTYMDPETGKLVYRKCYNINAFETSVVEDPAYVSAIGEILRPS